MKQEQINKVVFEVIYDGEKESNILDKEVCNYMTITFDDHVHPFPYELEVSRTIYKNFTTKLLNLINNDEWNEYKKVIEDYLWKLTINTDDEEIVYNSNDINPSNFQNVVKLVYKYITKPIIDSIEKEKEEFFKSEY